MAEITANRSDATATANTPLARYRYIVGGTGSAEATATGTLGGGSSGSTELSPSAADATAGANSPDTRYRYIIGGTASAEATATATLTRIGTTELTCAAADATAGAATLGLLRRILLSGQVADATSGASTLTLMGARILTPVPADATATATSDIVLRRMLTLARSDAVAAAPPPDLFRRMAASGTASATASASATLVRSAPLSLTTASATATATARLTRRISMDCSAADAVSTATGTLTIDIGATELSPSHADATAGMVAVETRYSYIIGGTASATAASSADLASIIYALTASATATATGTLTRVIALSPSVAAATAASTATATEIGTKEIFAAAASATASATATLQRRRQPTPSAASATASAAAALRFQAKELSFAVARARAYASTLTVTSEGGVRFSDVVIMRSARLALARLHRGRSRLGPVRPAKSLTTRALSCDATMGELALNLIGAPEVLTVSRANAIATASHLQLDKQNEPRVLGALRANATAVAGLLLAEKVGEPMPLAASVASCLARARGGVQMKRRLTASRINATSTARTATISKKTSAGYVNALDYATGNGTTDDTSALTTAANVSISQGKPLYFPAATYVITNWAPPANLEATGVGKTSWLKGKLRWRGGQSWSNLLIGSTTTSALGPYYSSGGNTHENTSFTACTFRGGGVGNPTLSSPAQGYANAYIVNKNITFTQCDWECNYTTTAQVAGTYAEGRWVGEGCQDVSWSCSRPYGDIADNITFDRCRFGSLNAQGRTGGVFGGVVFWTSHKDSNGGATNQQYSVTGDHEAGYYDNITFTGCTFERHDVWHLDLASSAYAPSNWTEGTVTITDCIFKGLSGAYHTEYQPRIGGQTEGGWDCTVTDNIFGIADTNAWKFIKGSSRCTLSGNIFDYRTYAFDTDEANGKYQIDSIYQSNGIIRLGSEESAITISNNQLLLPTGKYTGLGQQGWIYDPSNRATKTGNTVSWGSGSGPLANY